MIIITIIINYIKILLILTIIFILQNLIIIKSNSVYKYILSHIITIWKI